MQVTYDFNHLIPLQNCIWLYICHFHPWFFKHLDRYPITQDETQQDFKTKHTHNRVTEKTAHDCARALYYHIYFQTSKTRVKDHYSGLLDSLNI